MSKLRNFIIETLISDMLTRCLRSDDKILRFAAPLSRPPNLFLKGIIESILWDCGVSILRCQFDFAMLVKFCLREILKQKTCNVSRHVVMTQLFYFCCVVYLRRPDMPTYRNSNCKRLP